MVKKWEIAPAPNDKNPGRHKLLIKGEMKDIFLIVKKLGSLCSRPEKTSGAFNFIIYLSKFEMDVMAKLKAVTAELGAIQQEQEQVSPAAFQDEPAPFELPVPMLNIEPAPFELPVPKLNIEPAPRASAPPGVQRPVPAPAPQPAPAPAPEPSKPAPAQTPAPQPAPVPEPAPAAEPPKPAPQPTAPSAHPGTTQPRMNFVPSATTRLKKEDVPDPSPEPAAAAAPVKAAPAASKIKAKWSMELPLIPTYTFQSLVAGSHNRFAHAAAMAVVENPGTIYNPLLLFGVPGTGKTHFVNAVSNGLSASIGQSNIFVTDGVKFSRGVELAIKDGGIARLDEMFSRIKALIIDDAHLLMVSDANKKYISKWLNDFVSQNKQVMVTSVFPPKALAGLEQAVNFQFTQGWMVDLKKPPPQTYKVILNQLLQGMDVNLSEAELGQIFAQNLMPFGEAVMTLESMKKLEKFVAGSMNNPTHAELLEMLLGLKEVAPAPPSEEELAAAASWQPAAHDAWFKWGMSYPRGLKREAQYALCALHTRAKELGMNTEWKQVFMQEYNADEIYGTPFSIGNYASQQNVNGVLVLGPQPSSAIGAQEPEFRHLTFKILDSFLIKNAWLPAANLKSQAHYNKALMDLV
ncbi:MAG: hypothetical protein COT18_12600 [Elusimicrobia bacterium CG08_land_8_20_14_0_20_59_10]|nr:MAG: hypothetical protein COT18_12600 [Elusimicrobia bacterium CG08_land_8_20_14_0_20_59_10]